MYIVLEGLQEEVRKSERREEKIEKEELPKATHEESTETPLKITLRPTGVPHDKFWGQGTRSGPEIREKGRTAKEGGITESNR